MTLEIVRDHNSLAVPNRSGFHRYSIRQKVDMLSIIKRLFALRFRDLCGFIVLLQEYLGASI